MAFSSITGSFTKNTGTGTQSITGLGGTPKILILWTGYTTTTDTITNSYSYAFGFTTGASESYSSSFSAQQAATSNRSKRAAAKALTIVQYGETTLAECDLTSFDGDGFTLDWTTNSGGAQIIHYLAMWGSDITGQKVLTLTSPTSTGNKAYTGVGFKPDTLIMARPISTSALPVSAATADFALSLISGGGGTFSINVGGDDGVTSDPDSKTYRVIRTNKSTILTNTAAGTREESSWVSMDSDGFTLNYSTINAADLIGVLAIKGLRNKVGSITSFPVTGVGFAGAAALFIDDQRNSTPATLNAAMNIGAATGASANQSAVFDDPAASATEAVSLDSTGKSITRLFSAPPSIGGQSALSSFDSDGFTFTTAGATDIIGYLAFGSAPTIATNAATSVTSVSAQLNGTVNPKSSSASYYFEYGLTTSYGTTTATQGPTSGGDDLIFSQSVSGLVNGTTYHYRAVVVATGVTLYGSDQTFATPLGDLAVSFF